MLGKGVLHYRNRTGQCQQTSGTRLGQRGCYVSTSTGRPREQLAALQISAVSPTGNILDIQLQSHARCETDTWSAL